MTLYSLGIVECLLSYRLAAYHQFNNWTYSFLGRGNRRVVSACEVNAVCLQFSEADNVYSGLRMAGLILIISESGCIHMIVLALNYYDMIYAVTTL